MQHSNPPLQIVVQRTMRSRDRIMAAQLGSRHDYPVLTLCYISLASIVDMYGFNGFQMICFSQLARLSSSLGFVPVRCLILIAPLRPSGGLATWIPVYCTTQPPLQASSPQLRFWRRPDMARRPSTVSLSSVGSGSGLSKLTQLPPQPPLISRSSSKSLPNGSPLTNRQISVNAQVELAMSAEAWDPDELFTKHTVVEVKLIQQRLRCVP